MSVESKKATKVRARGVDDGDEKLPLQIRAMPPTPHAAESR